MCKLMGKKLRENAPAARLPERARRRDPRISLAINLHSSVYSSRNWRLLTHATCDTKMYIVINYSVSYYTPHPQPLLTPEQESVIHYITYIHHQKDNQSFFANYVDKLTGVWGRYSMVARDWERRCVSPLSLN